MPHWSRISGLNDSRKTVLDAAISSGTASDDYKEQLAAFKRLIVANADLVRTDRVRIIRGLEAEAASIVSGNAPVELHSSEDADDALARTAALGSSLEESRATPLDSR